MVSLGSGHETPTFCPLSDVADQMYNESLTSKHTTEGAARFLPSDSFLDVSQFQVFLGANSRPVTSLQGPFGQVDAYF